MPHLAQRERRSLADLLLRVGPDAPTLCEGWTAADLAAHLVIRERRPDAGLGLVVPFLAGHTRETSRTASVTGGVRGPGGRGPRRARPFPLRFSFIDEPMNTAEFFIHHEDVRRAQPGWEPRELDPELERPVVEAPLHGPHGPQGGAGGAHPRGPRLRPGRGAVGTSPR